MLINIYFYMYVFSYTYANVVFSLPLPLYIGTDVETAILRPRMPRYKSNAENRQPGCLPIGLVMGIRADI